MVRARNVICIDSGNHGALHLLDGKMFSIRKLYMFQEQRLALRIFTAVLLKLLYERCSWFALPKHATHAVQGQDTATETRQPKAVSLRNSPARPRMLACQEGGRMRDQRLSFAVRAGVGGDYGIIIVVPE